MLLVGYRIKPGSKFQAIGPATWYLLTSALGNAAITRIRVLFFDQKLAKTAYLLTYILT